MALLKLKFRLVTALSSLPFIHTTQDHSAFDLFVRMSWTVRVKQNWAAKAINAILKHIKVFNEFVQIQF